MKYMRNTEGELRKFIENHPWRYKGYASIHNPKKVFSRTLNCGDTVEEGWIKIKVIDTDYNLSAFSKLCDIVITLNYKPYLRTAKIMEFAKEYAKSNAYELIILDKD